MASKKIFIDSTALYAFIDRADANHSLIVKLMEQFSLNRMHLYSSLQSVSDTFHAINNQMGNTVALEFLQAMSETSIEILYPQRAEFVSTIKLMKLNRNKSITIREALISVLMEKKGINQILTFTYWHSLLGSESYLNRVSR